MDAFSQDVNAALMGTSAEQEISDKKQDDTPSPGAGKSTSPGTGQAGGSQADGQAGANPPQGQDSQNALNEEELSKHLGFSETPEQKSARLEREYSASSKEARRVKGEYDSIKAVLAEQGVDIAVENGKIVGLLPGKKYSKEAADLNVEINFKDLDENEQLLFEDNPQKAIRLIANRVLDQAKKALVRAAPTLDKVVQPISPEREDAAVEAVKGLVFEDGSERAPNVDKNMKFIKNVLSASNVPKALKEFYNQEPELALELLNARTELVKSYLTGRTAKLKAEQERKQQESLQSPSIGPNSAEQPSIGGTGNVSQDMAQAIASARH